MIIIIHGNDVIKTRDKIQEYKKAYSEINIIEGKDLLLENLKQNLEANSLFYEDKKRLLIVENLFSKNKTKDTILDYLINNSLSQDLLIWEEKEVKNKDFSELAKKSQVVKFNLPPIIFKFLDSLYPGNIKEVISYLNALIKTADIEMVFFMMVKLYRMLIQAKSGTKKGSSDYDNIMSWQKTKYHHQANKYSFIQLIYIYRYLEKIDYDIKNGKTDIDLISQLRLLFINYLK